MLRKIYNFLNPSFVHFFTSMRDEIINVEILLSDNIKWLELGLNVFRCEFTVSIHIFNFGKLLLRFVSYFEVIFYGLKANLR